LIRAKLDMIKHSWDPQTLNSTIITWLQSTVQKTLPDSLLLYVEASMLVSIFRKEEHVHSRVSTTLHSLPKETVENWVFQNLSRLWQVSEMSFRYFHQLMYQLTSMVYNLYDEPIWMLLSFCLRSITESSFKTPVNPQFIRSELQGEIPPQDGGELPEAVCSFAFTILKYKSKFETKTECGKLIPVWQWEQMRRYWCEYDKEQSNLIEDGFQKYKNSKDVEHGSISIIPKIPTALAPRGWKIDYVQLIQINVATNSERRIMREEFVQDLKFILWLAAFERMRKVLVMFKDSGCNSETLQHLLKEFVSE